MELLLLSDDYNLRTEQRTIRREGAQFIYTFEYDVVEMELTGMEPVSGFSLGAYAGVFRRRRCDPLSSIVALLKRIRRDTHPTENNVDLICSWVLSLSDLTRENENNSLLQIVFEDIYSLAGELDRLLELSIVVYTQVDDE